ncbi:MAG: hypothetical protein IPM57_04300 [Oligoflexia bacterium]|nr:hypothetical protein [Oligoflexia bacterium]
MPQTKTAALKPEAKDACTVLSDGSYRCKPNELRFFEKPERAFALPEKQNPQSEADGAATLAIPPPPPATPTPQN